MAHSRLLKHGGYTPLQLLFGPEQAPIGGETFNEEQQGRRITESMAERLTRQQSAMKAWLHAEAEFRIERAKNRRTCAVLHWPSRTRVCTIGWPTFRAWAFYQRSGKDLLPY